MPFDVSVEHVTGTSLKPFRPSLVISSPLLPLLGPVTSLSSPGPRQALCQLCAARRGQRGRGWSSALRTGWGLHLFVRLPTAAASFLQGEGNSARP